MPEPELEAASTVPTGLAAGSVVLVYLTEGIFNVAGFLDAVGRALCTADVKVVWVAETDMRHGWSEYEKRNPDNSGWKDAMEDSCRLIPAEFFERGALSAGTFYDRIILLELAEQVLKTAFPH